jgi:hypothetical protein
MCDRDIYPDEAIARFGAQLFQSMRIQEGQEVA